MSKDLSIMVDERRFNFRVGAIVECNNKVLLHKGIDKDYYNIPGGRCKIGESSLNAVKREIEEEVGILEEDYKLIYILENFFSENNLSTHELLYIYTIVLPSNHPLYHKNEFATNDNKKEINYWISKDEIINLKLKPDVLPHVINKKDLLIEHNIITRY